MKYYYCKLHGPRNAFGEGRTLEETEVMEKHVAYLREFTKKRQLVVFGPVADPQGFFGVTLWELEEGTDIDAICAADPAIKSKRGFIYEILPMPWAAVRE